jgi:anaerobic selenocysteine-containing dehydrogenase
MASSPSSAETAASSSTHYRICPLCEATCGLELTVEGDRVTRVRGDAANVFSGGYLCPKGASIGDLHADPDRLRKPLIREGDSWREVSFDEAFAEIERRLAPLLEAHGPSGVGVYLGNPNVHNLGGGLYGRPFLKALRTRNIFSASTVDQMPRHVSSGLLYGGPTLIPVPDLDRTDYLLMLGANPLESNGSLCTAPDFPGRLRAIRERGGKVVVVDPRRTRTADAADAHLAIRPSGDVYLLLAIAQVLLDEGLTTLGAAGDHVDGLDAIRERVRPFTPAAVSEHTGLGAESIAQLARELAAAPSAAIYTRIGAHTVRFGTLTSWAGDLVTLLTGNLDRAGGLMWPLAAHARASAEKPGGRGFQVGRWRSRVKDLPEVMGELPVATLADEIATPGEGQIRVLFAIGGNPALSAPNSGRLEAALEGLDLMVSVDLYRNETSRHAHVILPPPSPLERGHYDLAFNGLSVRNVAQYSHPVFDTDAPQESELLARLALIAMGQGAEADPATVDDMLAGAVLQDVVANEASALHGKDLDALREEGAKRPGPERILDLLLRSGPYGDRLSLAALEDAPHGIDLGPLEARLPGLLRTPSGRIELCPELIAQQLDELEASLATGPAPGLVLIGRRHVRSNNSWMHNIEKLVKGKPRCTLQVHPDDAKELGLSNGGQARVRSRVGEIQALVEIDAGIRRGVVSLPHGWGHGQPGSALSVAARYAGVNTNLLTDEQAMDTPSGTAVLNGIPVEVAAA